MTITPEQVAFFPRSVLRLKRDLQHSQPGRVFEDAFLHSDHPRIRRLTARWVQLGLT